MPSWCDSFDYRLSPLWLITTVRVLTGFCESCVLSQVMRDWLQTLTLKWNSICTTDEYFCTFGQTLQLNALLSIKYFIQAQHKMIMYSVIHNFLATCFGFISPSLVQYLLHWRYIHCAYIVGSHIVCIVGSHIVCIVGSHIVYISKS
jgi:hypothetical protein